MENNEEVELKKKEEGGCKHTVLQLCVTLTQREGRRL